MTKEISRKRTIISGFAIGAGMSVPGISGGTLAIIMGIYNRLINSVTGLFRKPKKSVIFLLLFCTGAVGGLLTAAKLIDFLLSTPAAVPLRFAFLGATAGCIPPILKEAKFAPISAKKILLLSGGVLGALLISMIPEGIFAFGGNSVGDILMQCLGGVLVAAALVLPGISASQMLYMLGLYEPMVSAISDFDIIKLIPIGIGLAAGTLATSFAISKLLEKTDGTYIVILGFMIFSLKDLLPQWSTTTELIIGIVCAIIGFALGLIISRGESKENKKSQNIVKETP